MVLTKRIYTKTQKVFFYGSGTLGSFFLLLLTLSYLGISVETSGDQVCADKCVSYFNISLTNWSVCLGSTFKNFTTEPNVRTEVYKADLRYSRSNPDRWKIYNFTARKCLEKGKKHEFMIKGYKQSEQTVKWGLDLQSKNIDPYWYGESNWTIEGNKVYVNDSNVYISAEPHTLENSGYVYFNLTSKFYSGNIDVVWGFDINYLQPRSAEIYKPEIETITQSYSCDFDNSYFNYTLNPNHFWCYSNITLLSNGTETGLNLIYEHDFDYGNLTLKTAYWNESSLREWQSISQAFDSIDYNYGGMNKWYYLKDISIEENKSYLIRGFIEFPRGKGFSPIKIDEKYWFAIKPSSETIQQSISNNHFYALDPWINSSGDNQNKDYLSTSLIGYWNMSSNEDSVAGRSNLTVRRKQVTFVPGFLGQGAYCNQSQTMNISNTKLSLNWNFNTSTATTINFWINETANNPTGYAGYLAKYVVDPYWLMASHTSGVVFGLGFTDYSPRPNVGSWTMWTIIKNSTSGYLLRNGTIVKTGTLYSGNPTIDTMICEAHTSGGLNRTLIGLIDELGIWNRSLNSSEVSDLYNNGLGITYNKAIPADTCTYTSGNWNVNCWDNCTISSNVNLGGNNITFTGVGSFTVQANITNIDNWLPISTNCKLMICTKCIIG